MHAIWRHLSCRIEGHSCSLVIFTCDPPNWEWSRTKYTVLKFKIDRPNRRTEDNRRKIRPPLKHAVARLALRWTPLLAHVRVIFALTTENPSLLHGYHLRWKHNTVPAVTTTLRTRRSPSGTSIPLSRNDASNPIRANRESQRTRERGGSLMMTSLRAEPISRYLVLSIWRICGNEAFPFSQFITPHLRQAAFQLIVSQTLVYELLLSMIKGKDWSKLLWKLRNVT